MLAYRFIVIGGTSRMKDGVVFMVRGGTADCSPPAVPPVQVMYKSQWAPRKKEDLHWQLVKLLQSP